MASIVDVPGIKVGHFHLEDSRTGCTVILPDKRVIAGVDVRGSAPGSREIELLKPVRLVEEIDAVLLTGGSAFGLDAAGGVQAFLEEQGRGYDVGAARVPIVPTAVIFDLAVGDASIRPNRDMGYQACERATNAPVEEGRIGVGCGATVGKLLGMEYSSPGGVGSAAMTLENGIIIGALSVINALGEVIDWQGDILAGIRNEKTSGFTPSLDVMVSASAAEFSSTNTTLAVVATNAKLTRETATKVAQMAQDGLALAVRPAHTLYDGDIVFVVSTGEKKCDVNTVGALSCQLVAESIRRGVRRD